MAYPACPYRWALYRNDHFELPDRAPALVQADCGGLSATPALVTQESATA